MSISVSEITQYVIFLLTKTDQKMIALFNLVFMNIKEHFPGNQTTWNVILALLYVKNLVEIITVLWDLVTLSIK